MSQYASGGANAGRKTKAKGGAENVGSTTSDGRKPPSEPSSVMSLKSAGKERRNTLKHIIIPRRESGRTVKSGHWHVCPLTSLVRRDCCARSKSSLEIKCLVLWPQGLTRNRNVSISGHREDPVGQHTQNADSASVGILFFIFPSPSPRLSPR